MHCPIFDENSQFAMVLCNLQRMDKQVDIMFELSSQLTDIKAFADNFLTILNTSTMTTQFESPEDDDSNLDSNFNRSFTTAASGMDIGYFTIQRY